MRLLIVTQVVDQNDSVLGFFHRWIEEFAKNCEKVHVICLKESVHNLPENVAVHSLGKESLEFGIWNLEFLHRLVYVFRFWRLIWQKRRNYDAVFVHMNPEYLVMAGWLWRLLGKKTALWYTHKSVDLKLRIAEKFADIIFTASRESFRLPSKKVQVVGHGIDTDFFTPDPNVPRGEHALSAGRLNKSKRHDLAIHMSTEQGRVLHIAGEGPERKNLEALTHSLNTHVEFLGAMTQLQLRDEYRKAFVLLHTSETGSLDKVVLEALACGLPVVTRDPALKHLESADREYVRREHSLTALIEKLVWILKNK